MRRKVSTVEYIKELEKYNAFIRKQPRRGRVPFLEDVKSRYSEFESRYEKKKNNEMPSEQLDIFQFMMEHSEFSEP